MPALSFRLTCLYRETLRSEEASRANGFFRGNTKSGAILDVKVYFQQGRYCVEMMFESSIRDRTVSWVSRREWFQQIRNLNVRRNSS